MLTYLFCLGKKYHPFYFQCYLNFLLLSFVLLTSVNIFAGKVKHEKSNHIQNAELVFSTFLGGSNIEIGKAAAVDEIGNVYITGQTGSSDFPVSAVSSSFKGGMIGLDLFVAKYDPDGVLLYSVYLGGSGDEIANDIKVDDQGRAHIVGSTTSADLPGISNALQQYQGGSTLFTDGFYLILSADGSAVEYATYFGGIDDDAASVLTLAPNGNVYIAGTTNSIDFPTTQGVLQQTFSDTTNNLDAFISCISPDGSGGYNLEFSTFFGGSLDDTPSGIALDQSGNIIFTGFTNSLNFPILNAIQNNFAGPLRRGEGDIFVSSINSTGTSLNFSTYFGGSQDDRSVDLVVDNSNNIFITGWTNSANFPVTAGSYQTERQGLRDRFIFKLSKISGSYTIEFSTRLGSTGIELGTAGLALDYNGGIWIGGSTNSDLFPVVGANYPLFNGGDTDAFLARLDSSGSSLTYSTFLGGLYADVISDIAFGVNTINLVGSTGSPNFPLQNPQQPIFDGPIPGGNITTSMFAAAFQVSAIVNVNDGLESPKSFQLYQNYPNPFNPKTTIRFDVKEKTKVNITLYDILGSRVRVLINSEYAAGSHEFNFNAENLASGVYFYKIKMDSYSNVKKMMLLK